MLGGFGFRGRRGAGGRRTRAEGQPPGAPHPAWTWLRAALRLDRGLRPLAGSRPLDVSAAKREIGAPASPLAQQRAELRARLLVHDPATQVVRNLYRVHNALKGDGWAGVEALSLKVVSRALIEAEILAVGEPSEMLDSIIDALRQSKERIERREAEEALASDWACAPTPEVSDTDFDEYELMERSWAGTVPARLARPRPTI